MIHVRLLGEAVADAKKANKELRAAMAKAGITTWLYLHQLPIWPEPVKKAHRVWMESMVDVVTILAAAEDVCGTEEISKLPMERQLTLTHRAYDLILEPDEAII